jgi:hypothetical protein
MCQAARRLSSGRCKSFRVRFTVPTASVPTAVHGPYRVRPYRGPYRSASDGQSRGPNWTGNLCGPPRLQALVIQWHETTAAILIHSIRLFSRGPLGCGLFREWQSCVRFMLRPDAQECREPRIPRAPRLPVNGVWRAVRHHDRRDTRIYLRRDDQLACSRQRRDPRRPPTGARSASAHRLVLSLSR